MRSGNRQPLGISALCGRLLTAIPVSPLDEVVRTLVSRIPQVQSSKSVIADEVSRSSKISTVWFSQQAFSGTTGITKDLKCLSKSLLVSQIAAFSM